MLNDDQFALVFVARLASIGTIIATLELFARPETLLDSGLSSWKVSQLAAEWLGAGHSGCVFNRLFSSKMVRVLLLVRLAAVGIVLAAGQHLQISGLAAAIVGTTSALLVLRSSYGHDGADQMLTLTFLSVALGDLSGSAVGRNLALWFIALQLCLSYLSAGISKVVSPAWRSGDALPGILSTDIYGNKFGRRVFRRRTLIARLSCWAVILFECFFPLSLAELPTLTIVFVMTGILFHLGTAVLMRLNTFLWAFCATYPALWYCARSGGIGGVHRHEVFNFLDSFRNVPLWHT